MSSAAFRPERSCVCCIHAKLATKDRPCRLHSSLAPTFAPSVYFHIDESCQDSLLKHSDARLQCIAALCARDRKRSRDGPERRRTLQQPEASKPLAPARMSTGPVASHRASMRIIATTRVASQRKTYCVRNRTDERSGIHYGRRSDFGDFMQIVLDRMTGLLIDGAGFKPARATGNWNYSAVPQNCTDDQFVAMLNGYQSSGGLARQEHA